MEFQLPSSSSNAYNVEVHQGFDKSSEDEMIKAALLHEVVDTRNKTPVSLLHELLSKRGRTPKYELVQTEGVIHEPIFRYRVSFANEDALGTGTSKKEAKHNAARDLLKKLCNNIDLDFDTPAKDGNAEDNDETTRNPIGRLQELCILRRWTPPIYDTEKEIGQAHNKNFVMVCKVAQFQEEGEGSSKKIAKRKAAFKMLKFLTTMNEESLENGIETSIINRYNDIKDLNFKKMGPNSKKDFEQAFAKMRTDTTPGIVELQGNNSIPVIGASSSLARPNPMDLESPHQVIDCYGQTIAEYLKHFPLEEAKFIFERIETDLILALKRRQHNVQYPNQYYKRCRNNYQN